MKKNSLHALTTMMAILLVTASAWAGNHQICYQVPAPAGTQRILVRFACRTDGVNPGNCTIESFQPSFTVITDRPVFVSRNDGSVEHEVEFQGSGIVTATFQFADGSVHKCTIEPFTLPQFGQNQNPIVLGFNTDQSGLVMTGVWGAVSAPADMAFREVMVPPDFIAVGGGAEGTEFPGNLVTASSSSGTRTWFAGVHSNVPAGTPAQPSPAIAAAIGLKIEGIASSTLQTMVQFPAAVSAGSVPHPSVSRTTDANGLSLAAWPQSVAAIGGGVQAGPPASSPLGQYVTTTQPLFANQCYINFTCEQIVTGWLAESKDHVNPSPGFVRASVTTLPKVLTINGATFHVETAVSQATSTVVAHPEITAALPGDFALTGVGAFVNWQTSPSAAGNMVWRLQPRTDINGVDAASKDQWFSSPASITAFAIGMKLVPGPVPFPQFNRPQKF
jgi:hypothetical protein